MNNWAWRDTQLNVIIQYNAPLKGNQVRDDCNIEAIKDPWLHYQRSLSSVALNTVTSGDIVNNRAWRHVQLNGVIQYNAPLKGDPVRDVWNIQTSKDP